MAPVTNSACMTMLPILASLITPSAGLPTVISRSPDTFPPKNSTASSLNWAPCPAEVHAPKNLQCASLSVPIDWEEPYGEHFNLGLVKLPAVSSNSSTKIGSLLINPGGPGGRASDLVAGFAEGAADSGSLLEYFDFIGLDPRGVGFSNQIKCNMTIFAERVSLFPQSEEDYEKLLSKNKRLAESCMELTGPLFEHIDTIK